MTKVKNLETLFAKFGVKPADFRQAFYSSPAIDLKLKQGEELMRK